MAKGIYIPSYPTPARGGALQPGFRTRGFGAGGVGNGGAATPPAEQAQAWRSDTVGQPPSNLAQDFGVGASAGTKVESMASVETHTKKISLKKFSDGYDRILLDIGESYDYSGGLKVQILMQTTDITKLNFQFIFQELDDAWGSGSTGDYLWGYYSQGENPDILRGQSRLDGTLYDTGNDSTGVDGTSPAWHYLRFEWIVDANFDGAFITTGGAHDDGSPFSSTWNASPGTPSVFPNSLRYYGFSATNNWYGVELAEIWFGTAAQSWPTAGEPQA